jgi:hypothetical protein
MSTEGAHAAGPGESSDVVKLPSEEQIRMRQRASEARALEAVDSDSSSSSGSEINLRRFYSDLTEAEFADVMKSESVMRSIRMHAEKANAKKGPNKHPDRVTHNVDLEQGGSAGEPSDTDLESGSDDDTANPGLGARVSSVLNAARSLLTVDKEAAPLLPIPAAMQDYASAPTKMRHHKTHEGDDGGGAVDERSGSAATSQDAGEKKGRSGFCVGMIVLVVIGFVASVAFYVKNDMPVLCSFSAEPVLAGEDVKSHTKHDKKEHQKKKKDEHKNTKQQEHKNLTTLDEPEDTEKKESGNVTETVVKWFLGMACAFVSVFLCDEYCCAGNESTKSSKHEDQVTKDAGVTDERQSENFPISAIINVDAVKATLHKNLIGQKERVKNNRILGGMRWSLKRFLTQVTYSTLAIYYISFE